MASRLPLTRVGLAALGVIGAAVAVHAAASAVARAKSKEVNKDMGGK